MLISAPMNPCSSSWVPGDSRDKLCLAFLLSKDLNEYESNKCGQEGFVLLVEVYPVQWPRNKDREPKAWGWVPWLGSAPSWYHMV